MKKDRNCGCGGNTATPYPVYQPPMMPMMPNTMYQGSIPVMPNMGMQNMPMMNQNYQSSTIDQQLNNLNNQVSNLERRVSNLENMIGSNVSSNYNTSNFQMM